MTSGPRPLVVVGPSGVGKGTLLKRLRDRFPDAFGFSISHTTRAPRAGEINGINYHFVSRERMQEMINSNRFIEHANVHGNLYGTSIASIDAVQRSGKICLLEIDVQGAQRIHEAKMPARFLFISPPSPEALRERLLGRGSESAESMELRLKNALGEIDFYNKAGFFDDNIVNDNLDDAFRKFEKIVTNWYPHLNQQK